MPNPTVETLDLPHERHCGAQRPEVRCGPGVDVSLSSEATRSALDLYLLHVFLSSVKDKETVKGWIPMTNLTFGNALHIRGAAATRRSTPLR